MWTKAFWMATAERAAKTFAQALAALLLAAGTGLLNTDWVGALSGSAMAALLSVLTSIATAAFTDGTPSIGNVESFTVAEIEPDADEAEEPVELEDDSEATLE